MCKNRAVVGSGDQIILKNILLLIVGFPSQFKKEEPILSSQSKPSSTPVARSVSTSENFTDLPMENFPQIKIGQATILTFYWCSISRSADYILFWNSTT